VTSGLGPVSLMPFYKSRGLKLVKAQGQYVWDEQGRRYLDFHTGYGVAFLGHRHPRIVSALTEQLELLMTATPVFDTEAMEKCLRQLSKILPAHLTRVYFQNSGAEAVELALKVARKSKGRSKFMAFSQAFHGRTMGALGVTWSQKYREGFGPFPWEVTFQPFNDTESLSRTLSEEYAAVIVEPVQGEGGIVPASGDFLKRLQERCQEVGALLIFDEVQTGFGRTGRIWAHQHYGVQPDILVAGKAIGGGFPTSLVAVSEEISSGFKQEEHGSTYGGNPLALSAISAAIDVLLSENVSEQAAVKGEKLAEALTKLFEEHGRFFRAVRSRGLMIGLEMRFTPSPLIQELQARGLLALKAGLTVLRFLPPYLITDEDIERCLETLGQALASRATD